MDTEKCRFCGTITNSAGCPNKCTEDKKPIVAQEEIAVQTLPITSLVMAVAPGKGFKFDICPFCFAVSVFPQNVINTSKHKCVCGAKFTSLGHATKIIKSEVIQ